jgi:hypothetical protein
MGSYSYTAKKPLPMGSCHSTIPLHDEGDSESKQGNRSDAL